MQHNWLSLVKPWERLNWTFRKHFFLVYPFHVLYSTRSNQFPCILLLILDQIYFINLQALISLWVKLVEPNWDYFVHAPLENGLVLFETKTERALYAKVIASEANWMESQTCDRFITYLRARQDLDSFREGFEAKKS